MKKIFSLIVCLLIAGGVFCQSCESLEVKVTTTIIIDNRTNLTLYASPTYCIKDVKKSIYTQIYKIEPNTIKQVETCTIAKNQNGDFMCMFIRLDPFISPYTSPCIMHGFSGLFDGVQDKIIIRERIDGDPLPNEGCVDNGKYAIFAAGNNLTGIVVYTGCSYD